MSDEVVLEVPSTPDLVGLARIATTGIAGRLGFSSGEVDDVRRAVDTLCDAIVPVAAAGHGAHLRVRFALDLDTSALAVEGRSPGQAVPSGAAAEVRDLVDEVDLLASEGPLGPGFRLRKRHR